MIVRPDIMRARRLRAGLETDGRLALEIASYAPFKHSWPYAVRFLETFSSAAVAKANMALETSASGSVNDSCVAYDQVQHRTKSVPSLARLRRDKVTTSSRT